MLSLCGHLGDKVAALVDRQLPPEQEERAWSHVLSCPGCRRRVEEQAWAKQQLRGLRGAEVPAGLPRPLPEGRPWLEVEAPGVPRRRRQALAVAGGVTTAASVLALSLAGGLTNGAGEPRRPSTSSWAGSVSDALPGDLSGQRPGTAARPTAVGTPTGTETVQRAVWTRRSR